MDSGLKNKTALVTGGTTGIGAAVTRLLSEEGCRTAANYIVEEDRAQAFAKEIREQTGVPCEAVYGDVSDPDSVENLFRMTERILGDVDIVINSAAVLTASSFVDLSLEQWKQTIDVNLTGTFLVTQTACRRFLQRGSGGKVINIVSQSVYNGTRSGHAHYTAAKAGVIGMMRSAVLELSPKGIMINCIAPGIVETELVKNKVNARRKEYEERIPAGKIAAPRDIARAVLYLAGSSGDYITGSVLDVSGGMIMR